MSEVYTERARQQFTTLLKEKVRWMANDCWPRNLGHNLEEVNALIEAAKRMGVATASTFSEAEIEKLVEDWTPFRVLEMKGELYLLIAQAIQEKGIHHEFFAE